MAKKISAATTARPTTPTLRDAEKAALARWSALPTTTTTTTPTQAAALPPAAPPTETTMAQILGRIPLKERPARLAPTASPQRATRRTPLTIAALKTALPIWKTFTPALRVYNIDRYIDAPGLAALAHKMGAKVVFTNDALTTLAALDPEQRALRRDALRDARRAARRAEAERLDAERTAIAQAAARATARALEEAAQRRAERALAQVALKKERTALALALAGELTVTTAAARRALADAEWNMEDARRALELAAMKAEERKERKEERKEASDALSAAPGKVKTALKAVKNQTLKGRIALALAELKGRLLAVGLKAALALAAAATTPDANTTLTTDRIHRVVNDAVMEEEQRAAFRTARKLKVKTALKEVTNCLARAKGGEKGTPQALTLSISLSLKVRG